MASSKDTIIALENGSSFTPDSATADSIVKRTLRGATLTLLPKRDLGVVEAELKRRAHEKEGDGDNAKHLLKLFRHILTSRNQGILRDHTWLSTSGFANIMRRLDKDMAIGECIDKASTGIQRASDGLAICMLGESSGRLREMYPFLRQIAFLFSRRLDDADQLATSLIVYLLQLHWADDSKARATISEFTDLHAVSPSPLHLRWQPGINKIGLHGSAREHSRYLSLAASPPPLTFPTILEWQWLRDPIVCNSDYDIFISEPLREHPTTKKIRLLLLESPYRRGRRAILTAHPESTFQALETDWNQRHDSALLYGSLVDQQLHLLSSICELIRSDLEHFLQSTLSRIEQINMGARSRPTTSKSKYLAHIQECFDLNTCSCDNAIQSMEGSLATMLPFDSRDREHYDSLSDLQFYKRAFGGLKEELTQNVKFVVSAKGHVKEQRDIVQDERNHLLGVLAAVYVSLSFSSSFFGMNVTTSSNSRISTTQFYVNATTPTTTTATSPSRSLDSRDAAPAHSNSNIANTTRFSIDQPNNEVQMQWPIQYFVIMSVGLILGTVYLPLVAGSAFRRSVKFSRKHKIWWRVIASIFIIIVTFGFDLVAGFGRYGNFRYWDTYSDWALDVDALIPFQYPSMALFYLLCLFQLYAWFRNAVWGAVLLWFGVMVLRIVIDAVTIALTNLFSYSYYPVSEGVFFIILAPVSWVLVYVLWWLAPRMFRGFSEVTNYQIPRSR